MKVLVWLLLSVTVVRGNYLMTMLYTSSNDCADGTAGRIYVNPDADCAEGISRGCQPNGEKMSSSQLCLATLPTFQGEPHVIKRSYANPTCTGEPTNLAYFFINRCTIYERFQCIGDQLTVRRFETAMCDSAAGQRQTTASIGKCLSSGVGAAHTFECVK